MAFGDIFGKQINYSRNDDGSTSIGTTPGLVGKALGIPSTYERNYAAPVQGPVQGPVVPAAAPVAAPVQPTVGSVMGTAPATNPNSTIAQTLESVRQQALALQAQLPTATNATKRFSSPTPLSDPEKPWSPMTAQQEREIQRNQMQLFQKEIDATNQIYDQMVRQAHLQGEGRLGSTAAMGGRAGLMGSDFQAAQVANVEAENRGIISGIQGERLARIEAIMGKGRQSAADEIAAKNKANREGAEAKIKFMAEKQDRKSKNLAKLAQSLIEQEIDPAELSEQELSEIAKSYGTTVNDVKDSYNSLKVSTDAESAKTALSTRKTEAEISKIESDIASGKLLKIGEGDMLYNTETGETFKNPKTYAPSDSGSGTFVGTNGGTPFVGQQNYSKLTVKQKNQADSLNNLIREMNNYKNYYDQNRGAGGGIAGNMFGADAGQLETMLNGIIFAAAQAEGTGALQKPDREVIEKMIPNPTSFAGAFNTLTKGGADANIARIENQIKKYENNLKGYGLSPVYEDLVQSGSAVVQQGTLPNGTQVTRNMDGSITDSQGNQYDEDGNLI